MANRGGETSQFHESIDSLIQRLTQLRTHLANLLFRIENTDFDADLELANSGYTQPQVATYQTLLEAYGLVSSELTMLNRAVRERFGASSARCELLPLRCSNEPDPALLRATENRVAACSADMIPTYLRTKPEPRIDEASKQLKRALSNQQNGQAALGESTTSANSGPTPANVAKLCTSHNKVLGNLIDQIGSYSYAVHGSSYSDATEERNTIGPTSSMDETKQLLDIINAGHTSR